MNRQGQALTEFLLPGLLGITCVCFSFFFGMKILYTMATDELLEVYCICRLTGSDLCKTELVSSLKILGFKNIDVSAWQNEITVKAEAAEFLRLERTREFRPL